MNKSPQEVITRSNAKHLEERTKGCSPDTLLVHHFVGIKLRFR